MNLTNLVEVYERRESFQPSRLHKLHTYRTDGRNEAKRKRRFHYIYIFFPYNISLLNIDNIPEKEVRLCLEAPF